MALTRTSIPTSAAGRSSRSATRDSKDPAVAPPLDDESASPTTLKPARAGVHGQAHRYLSALMWVARDALPRYRGRVAMIIVCNLLAVACAGGAVGGVMLYARHAEHGQPIRILQWTIEFARSSGGGGGAGADFTSLFICGGIVALLGVLSAIFQYLTDNLILSTTAMHQSFCAERAMTIVHDPLCRGWQLLGRDDEGETPRHLASRMIGSASKQTALALRDMLRILLPALTFAAAVAFLVWVDLRITVIVLPIALLYLLPLYLINRQVTRRQKRYRSLAREARGEVGRTLRTRMTGGSTDSAEPTAALRSQSYRGALAAFYGRLLADRRTHMLNTSFFVACLVALLMFFGVQSREHGRPWSDLLFYLVALRFAMTALRQVTTLLAKFSRFFPEYRAYGAFVTETTEIKRRREQSTAADANALPESLTIRLGRRTMWNSPRTITINRASSAANGSGGATLWVLSPLAMDYIDLESLAARLETLTDQPVDLATQAMFIARAVDVDGGGRDEALAAAPMVVVNDDVLPRRSIAASLSRVRAYLVIASHRPDAALLTIAERNQAINALILDGAEVLGGGDAVWLKANIAAISAELTRRADESRHRAAGDDDAGDDDDEDEDAE